MFSLRDRCNNAVETFTSEVNKYNSTPIFSDILILRLFYNNTQKV